MTTSLNTYQQHFVLHKITLIVLNSEAKIIWFCFSLFARLFVFMFVCFVLHLIFFFKTAEKEMENKTLKMRLVLKRTTKKPDFENM